MFDHRVVTSIHLALMTTKILLHNQRSWRNERFTADFKTWPLAENPPDDTKNAHANQNIRKDEPFSFQSPFLVLVVMSVFYNQNDEAP